MGCTDFETSDIEEVFGFFKAIVRLIVSWMQKIQSLTTSIDELNLVPNLFLVDSQAAIVECYYELMETLSKLFGNCFRTVRFYMCHDTEAQTQPENI
jgi:hypothetical protein